MADMACTVCRIAAVRTEIRISVFVFVIKIWLARLSQLRHKYLLHKAQTLRY